MFALLILLTLFFAVLRLRNTLRTSAGRLLALWGDSSEGHNLPSEPPGEALAPAQA